MTTTVSTGAMPMETNTRGMSQGRGVIPGPGSNGALDAERQLLGVSVCGLCGAASSRNGGDHCAQHRKEAEHKGRRYFGGNPQQPGKRHLLPPVPPRVDSLGDGLAGEVRGGSGILTPRGVR